MDRRPLDDPQRERPVGLVLRYLDDRFELLAARGAVDLVEPGPDPEWAIALLGGRDGVRLPAREPGGIADVIEHVSHGPLDVRLDGELDHGSFSLVCALCVGHGVAGCVVAVGRGRAGLGLVATARPLGSRSTTSSAPASATMAAAVRPIPSASVNARPAVSARSRPCAPPSARPRLGAADRVGCGAGAPSCRGSRRCR